MSEKKSVDTMKYFEKKDIKCVTIDVAKRLLKNDIVSTMRAWESGHDFRKQSFRIVGPAGVGKTEICQQIVEELTELTNEKWRLIMIKAPLFSRDDFIIPYPTIEGDKKTFEMLYSDFVPFDESDKCLLVFDEENRADYPTQQVLMQLKNEGAIHMKKLPKHCWVISLDNPDDGEYMLNAMEDAAVLRRQLQLYVDASPKPFLEYARKRNFHKHVIDYITSNPQRLYDYKCQTDGKIFPNPASWERVSEALIKHDFLVENDCSMEQKENDLDSILSGLLNTNHASLFIEYMKENKDINPEDIFFHYSKEKKRVLKLAEDKDNASLGRLMEAFILYLSTNTPKYNKTEMANVSNFLADIPIDTSVLFVTAMDSYDRKSSEFMYFYQLNDKLVKNNERYKTMFFEQIHLLGTK